VNDTLLSDLEIARLERPHRGDAVLVREMAEHTVQELGLAAPVDPGLVASYRGISRIEEADQPWAGCLTHDGDEAVVRVRAADSRPRKRFTAFHEVEHTYLPGFLVTQYRCDPSPSRSQDRGSIEQLADLGASELLFPRNQFQSDLVGNRLSFELVEALSERYDGSLMATALRTVGLSHSDALLICVEPGVKPTQPNADPLPRIQWSAKNGDWPFILRHKSIPPAGPIQRALLGEPIDEIDDLAGMTASPLPKVAISCRHYPFVDQNGEIRDRVLCLATR
jgi:hypothetical protein